MPDYQYITYNTFVTAKQPGIQLIKDVCGFTHTHLIVNGLPHNTTDVRIFY